MKMGELVRIDNKLVEMNNEMKEVNGYIQRFFDQLNTDNTRKDYLSSIKDFFGYVKNKDIEELLFADLQLTLDDFDKYISHLINDKGAVASTINKKLSGVKSLLRFLKPRGIVNDIEFISAIKNLQGNTESYNALTDGEIESLKKFALTEKKLGLEKQLLVRLAYDTCLRRNELLTLKWSQLIDNGDGEVVFKGVGKGQKGFKRKISKEFYDELSQIRKEGDELIFNISDHEFKGFVKRGIDSLEIDSERKIVFHSIRKAGAMYHYKKTKDILYVQKILGHKDPKTTVIYLEVEDYGALGAESTKGQFDLDIINQVSHEDLLKAIDKMDAPTKILLAQKLKNM